jgi:hypothetical protein
VLDSAAVHETTDRSSASSRRLTSASTSGGKRTGMGAISAALRGAEKIQGADG